MKINFILPGLGQSGGIAVIEKYSELMRKEKQDVVIYASIRSYNLHRYRYSVTNWFHQIYCTLKSCITFLSGKKRDYCWVWKIDKKHVRDADATVATMWATAFEVDKLPETCGEKFYFIQGYEVWDNKEFAQQSYMLPLKKIVISTWINQKLKDELDMGPFPVVVNGLDFVNDKHKHDECHEKIHFLMLNHILPEKGVKDGLKAFGEIRKKYNGCCLRMFGMCSEGNLPDWVEYYRDPSREVLAELYGSTDIFIFPSLEEGWGLTPLEAMASGCAVAGTNTGFVLDLGVDHENMLIAPTGDIDKMVSNLTELVENTELRKKLQLGGYETVKKLVWKDSVKRILDILQEKDDDGCR